MWWLGISTLKPIPIIQGGVFLELVCILRFG